MDGPGERNGSWTLLTGHGHVLVEIARHPDARIRDISLVVGLTERTVQVIVADLEAEGYLTRARVGRRTRYTLNPDSPFRHSAQDGYRVGPLLDQLTAMANADPPGPPGGRDHQGLDPGQRLRVGDRGAVRAEVAEAPPAAPAPDSRAVRVAGLERTP
jgi:hypothetical protein